MKARETNQQVISTTSGNQLRRLILGAHFFSLLSTTATATLLRHRGFLDRPITIRRALSEPTWMVRTQIRWSKSVVIVPDGGGRDLSLVLLTAKRINGVESVVSGVASRLGELLIQEANFLSGVSHQVQKLQTELKWMQCFLKNENTMVREWVVEIRDLAYDAEDIIETYVFKVASRRGGGIQKVLMRCACILDEGTTVHKLGSEIVEIKTTISELTARLQTYGIIRQSIEGDRRLSSINDSQQQQRQTFPHVKPADVVGLDENISELVACLTTNKEKRVVSICGMPGVGKTTLAKMVYHHPEVKNHFDCLAWAYISQQCQRRQVWLGILISLVSPSGKRRKELLNMLDDELAKELHQVQQNRKCLVVLDDIWTIQAWRDLHA
uniref:NB-ARC domain-containing protein n=1 Tax=Fagus sylvatica TaxID=28930 RepID=A0A2N9FM37_FAGSY